MTKGGAVIEVRHVTKSYGSLKAVDDLSFTLEGSGVYGLLGPNGAGKTTTMNIMTGCLAANAGSVTVDGKDILDDAVAVKRRIGYLPEQPPLYPEMTAEEFLTFVAMARGVKQSAAAAQVGHALDAAGVSEVKNRLIKNLSKGYKQRVGIAMALIGDPDIIILDEPTVGLDPLQITEIRALIRELGEHHTVLLSSHILPEVSAVSDRVIILSHGRIAADGTPEELKRRLEGQSLIQLTAKGSADRVADALKHIPGVTGITTRKGRRSGYTDAEVRFDGASGDVCEAISAALMERHIPVTRLEDKEMSLEEIFLDITEDKEAPALHEQGEEDDDGRDL